MIKHSLAAAISAVLATASINANAANTTPIDGQFIVAFKQAPGLLSLDGPELASAIQSTANDLVNLTNVELKQTFDQSAFQGMLVSATPEQLAELRNNPNIAFIEQDQVVTIDPQYSVLADQNNATWGIDRVDQRSLPLNGNYHYDYTGQGVSAYIIDTGVNINHREFGNRARHGYDFIDNDNNASDCQGHGTHVAGTVAGNTYGVAKGAEVVAVRVLGCTGSGSYSGIINGINWVANDAAGRRAVANMSLGGGASSSVDNAVNNAVARGVNIVVAAGNDNSSACNYSPARARDAITVGSTTRSDARSSFSNYGSCLDIYAPGSNITSAWYNSNTATRTISGTSMAAPHVAGAVALLLEESPNLSPAQVTSELVNRATSNKVTDAKSGSPNKLLYTLAGTITPPDDAINTVISGTQGSFKYYTIDVPAGANLNVSISGGSGDADLYVRYNARPTTSAYDCRPYRWGNNETCSQPNAQGGTWHVGVRAYSSYSNVNLVATVGTVLATVDSCADVAQWSANTSYQPGDFVATERGRFVATHYSTGMYPENAAAWSSWEATEQCK